MALRALDMVVKRCREIICDKTDNGLHHLNYGFPLSWVCVSLMHWVIIALNFQQQTEVSMQMELSSVYITATSIMCVWGVSKIVCLNQTSMVANQALQSWWFLLLTLTSVVKAK